MKKFFEKLGEIISVLSQTVLAILLLAVVSLPISGVIYFITQRIGIAFLSDLSFWQVYGLYWIIKLIVPTQTIKKDN